MKKETKKEILNRMNYLIGHLNGVKKMIEKDEYCVDIIRQNKGVISAINKVNEIIFENHLNTCVVKAIKGKNKKEKEDKVEEILEIFKSSNKIK